MNVAIVTKALAPYRVRFYDEIAKNVIEQGGSLTVIVARAVAEDHPWQDLISKASHAKFVFLKKGGLSSKKVKMIQRFIRVSADISLPSRELISELKQTKPSVVWVHEYSPYCMAAVMWAKLNGITRVVSTDVGVNPPVHACSRLQLNFQKMTTGMFDGVIANTPEATRRGERDRRALIYAPHAIDNNLYNHTRSPESDKLVKFLYVGRLLKNKGLPLVLKCFKDLSKAGFKFQFTIVGSGELEKEIINLSKDVDWLEYKGFQEGENLIASYQNSGVFVLPTLEDTYGVVVHEAAASSLALLVSNQAGITEKFVRNGENGFCQDAQDEEKWLKGLRFYIENPDKVREHGIKSKAISDEYCVTKLASNVFEWLKSFHK